MVNYCIQQRLKLSHECKNAENFTKIIESILKSIEKFLGSMKDCKKKNIKILEW